MSYALNGTRIGEAMNAFVCVGNLIDVAQASPRPRGAVLRWSYRPAWAEVVTYHDNLVSPATRAV